MKQYINELLKFTIYPLFWGAVNYLSIDVEVVSILCILMLIDSATGVVKSLRLNIAEFEFRVLLWGIVLKILMLGIPITIALMGKGVGYDLSILVGATIRIMIISESYSILGNIYSAINKKRVKKVDAVSMALVSIRKTLFVFIQNSIKKVEDSAECNFKDRDDLKDKSDQV